MKSPPAVPPLVSPPYRTPETTISANPGGTQVTLLAATYGEPVLGPVSLPVRGTGTSAVGPSHEAPTASNLPKHCHSTPSTLRESVSPALSPASPTSSIMVNNSSSGGTSLAPTPTHPHHLSREPSREDVEMAEQLSQLNQVQDTRISRITSPSQAHQPATPPPTHTPEIYHSLDDSRPLRESEQPEQPSMPSTPASLPHSNVATGNALMTGQVCRCVFSLIFVLPPVPQPAIFKVY